MATPNHTRNPTTSVDATQHFGEMDLQFAYKGLVGAPFPVLQIDPEALSQVAGTCGWTVKTVRSTGGHHLARMRPV